MRAIKGSKSDQQFLRGWTGGDWLYPPARWDQASATMGTAVGHAQSGFESPMAVGSATMVLLNGRRAAQMGGGNNDNNMLITHGAHVQLAKLPADTRLEDFRRIHWWSWMQRVVGPGTARFFCVVHLMGNQVGTTFYGANTAPTLGHGIGLTLNGAGLWQFTRKVSAATSAGPSEEFPLVWPRPLGDWTEVWFTILNATATLPARFRLYIDRELQVERAWPDDGVTGSLNPILESGALDFRWGARANAVAHPGLLLSIAGWRYRQGFYDVDGSELTGL